MFKNSGYFDGFENSTPDLLLNVLAGATQNNATEQDQQEGLFRRMMQSLAQPVTNSLPDTGGVQEIESHPLISTLNRVPPDIRTDLVMSLVRSGVRSLDDFDRIYGGGIPHITTSPINYYPSTSGLLGVDNPLNQPIYEDPTTKLLTNMSTGIGQNPFGVISGNTLGINMGQTVQNSPSVNTNDPWFDPGQAFATTQSSVLRGIQGANNLYSDLQSGSVATGYRHGSMVNPGGYTFSPEEQSKARQEIEAKREGINTGFNTDYGHIFEKANESNAVEGFVGEAVNPVNWVGAAGKLEGYLIAKILERALIAGSETALLEGIRLRGEAEDPNRPLTEEQIFQNLLLAAGLGGGLGAGSQILGDLIKSAAKNKKMLKNFPKTDAEVLNRIYDSDENAKIELTQSHWASSSKIRKDHYKVVKTSEGYKIIKKDPDDLKKLRRYFYDPTMVRLRDIKNRYEETININSRDRWRLRASAAKELYGGGAEIKGRQIHLLIGPPGAGKSTFAENLLNKHRAMLIDSDEAKELIPEFRDGNYADIVHKESREIIERVIYKAKTHGDNIVHPIVGDTEERVITLAKEFSDIGYDVHLTLIHVDMETAVERVYYRQKKTGRFVDPLYVYRVGNKPLDVYAKIKNNKYIKSYKAYDNEEKKSILLDEGEN